MTVWLMIGVVLFAIFVRTQSAEAPAERADLLVLPSPGVPISLEQVEEGPRKLQDGTYIVEVKRTRIRRDSAGRLRIESNIRGASPNSFTPYTDLIDPVAGTRLFWLGADKVVHRMPWPKSSGGRLVLLGIDQASSSEHKWKMTTENAGKRTIEEIDFDGTRTMQMAEGEPGLTYTIDQWSSDELKLIGLVSISGPYGTHTARIQLLSRDEPDPALFAVPPDYSIVDVKLPDQQ
jgi:hypothetical protein